MTIAAETKTKLISEYRRHEGDAGSPEVQIAILTSRIGELTEHLKTHSKDHAGRRGLLMMVSKRNRLLRYLGRSNREAYQATIKRLGLRK
jgi:small subunit ribosomal protein S15